MLGDIDVIATVAVKDLQAAATFYEGTLGLERVASEGEEVITYRSGKTLLNVYRSTFAGTNKATALTWAVGSELEGLVRQLKGRAVKFEHYDMPGITRDGDIHYCGDMKVAWFTDPDGNIVNIINQ